MTRQQIVEQIFTKGSYLIVGLDTDPAKLPAHLKGRKDGMLLFNKAIIDATRDYCVGYKINTAFYEAHGRMGWEVMEETISYIPSTFFKIADAKRGDIGNTSAQYAKAFFETMNFDAITVAPYMGEDSVKPFLEFRDKWTILLGLTSNPGAKDFELKRLQRITGTAAEKANLPLSAGLHDGEFLYETVLRTASHWGTVDNLMFVIGATNPSAYDSIRNITPFHFYLVPGVGAQGGSLQEVSRKAMIANCGLMVNASRAIIYASANEDFADAAALVAKEYAAEMKTYLPKPAAD